MINKKIKLIMERLGFKTQASFAEALGVGRERINNYLKEKSLPDTQFYQVLKKKYPTIDINSLIDDSVDYVSFGSDDPVFVSDVKTSVDRLENDYIKSLKDEIQFLRNLVLKSNHYSDFTSDKIITK